MDILTLELLDVTVFQALLELRAQLAEHPGEALLIRGEDEMLRVNVAGYLEKQGRGVRQTQQGSQWELVVAAVRKPSAPPAAISSEITPRPVLLLRSAFSPGDRALGRRLLLETLAQLEPGTPWLCLAHQAVELLEDPGAVAILEGLQGKGIAIRVSAPSLAHTRQEDGGFDLVQDGGWQKLLARGLLTVL